MSCALLILLFTQLAAAECVKTDCVEREYRLRTTAHGETDCVEREYRLRTTAHGETDRVEREYRLRTTTYGERDCIEREYRLRTTTYGERDCIEREYSHVEDCSVWGLHRERVQVEDSWLSVWSSPLS